MIGLQDLKLVWINKCGIENSNTDFDRKEICEMFVQKKQAWKYIKLKRHLLE